MVNDFSANEEPTENAEQAPVNQSVNIEKVTIDDVLALAEETFPNAQLPLGLIINYETLRKEYPPLNGLTQHAAHLISGNPQWDPLILLHTTVLDSNERHEDILAKVAKELAEADPYKDPQPTKFLTMAESMLAELHWAWEGQDENEVIEEKLQNEIVELKSELQKHHACTVTRNNSGAAEESPAFVERDIHNTVIQDLQAEQVKNESLNQKNVEKDIRLTSLSEEVQTLRTQVLSLTAEKSSLDHLLHSKNSALNAQSETVHHLVEKVNIKDKHIIEQSNQLWTLRKLHESNANTLHLEKVIAQKDMEIERLTQHFQAQLQTTSAAKKPHHSLTPAITTREAEYEKLKREHTSLAASQSATHRLERENSKLRRNVDIASWILHMRGQYIPSYYPNQFAGEGHRFTPQQIAEGIALFQAVAGAITRIIEQRREEEEELDDARIRIFELERLSAEEQRENVKTMAGLEWGLRDVVAQNEVSALQIRELTRELEEARAACRGANRALEGFRYAAALKEKEWEVKLSNAVYALEEYKALGSEDEDSDSEDDDECDDEEDGSDDGDEDGSDSEGEGSYDGDEDGLAADCPRVLCVVKFAELRERYKDAIQRLGEFEEAQNSLLAEHGLSRDHESDEDEEDGEDEYEDASEGCDSDEDSTEDNDDDGDDESESDSGDNPVSFDSTRFSEFYNHYNIAIGRIIELELALAKTSADSTNSQLEFQTVVDELDDANRRLDTMSQEFAQAQQDLEDANDCIAHLEENEDKLNDTRRILDKKLVEAQAQECRTAEAAAEAADELDEVRVECNSLYTYISELEEQNKNCSDQLEKEMEKHCEYKRHWETLSNQYGILKVYTQNLVLDLEKKNARIASLEHPAGSKEEELRETKHELAKEKEQRRQYLDEEFVQRTRLGLQQQSNKTMHGLINNITQQAQGLSLQNHSLYTDIQNLRHANEKLKALLNAAHNENALLDNKRAALAATTHEQLQTIAHYNTEGEKLVEENNQKCAEIYRLEQLFAAEEKAHKELLDNYTNLSRASEKLRKVCVEQLREAEERAEASQEDSERVWELKVTELKQALDNVQEKLAQEQETATRLRAHLSARLAISGIPLFAVKLQHAARLYQWKTQYQTLKNTEESVRILYDREVARCRVLEDKLRLTKDAYLELCHMQEVPEPEAPNKPCAEKQAVLDEYRTAIVDLENTKNTLTERCNHNQALIDVANMELKHLAATDRSQKELLLLHQRQNHTQATMINKLEADVNFHKERVSALESYLNEEYEMQLPIDTEPVDISSSLADGFSDCEFVDPEECGSQ